MALPIIDIVKTILIGILSMINAAINEPTTIPKNTKDPRVPNYVLLYPKSS